MGQLILLTSGAYFGESTIKMFWEAAQTGNIDNVFSLRTAQCQEGCKLGVLSITTIEANLGSEHVHFKKFRNSKFEKMKDKLDQTITMDSLKKHSLLGIGTFGKVWMVSKVQDKAAKKVGELPIAYALKIQDKRELLKCNQVDGLMREKNIMASIDCPFIIRLVNTYQDNINVYMLIDLVQGGELLTVMNMNYFSEEDAKFYAAGVLLGLEYMHNRQIVYRDLKPENILIDKKGYTVIVDMGFGELVSFLD